MFIENLLNKFPKKVLPEGKIMRITEYLKRIQNLPLLKKKVIFWIIIIILGLILLFLWIINIRQTIKAYPKEKFLEQIKPPKIGEELEKLPKFEIPEEKIEEIKESVK